MSKHLPTADEDPEYHNMTAALGRVITCWARVEDELANVFAHAIKATAYQARAVFYAVRSFEARLDLVTEAVGHLYPPLWPSLEGEWSAIINATTRKARKCNEMAHCAIVKCVGPTGEISHMADPFCAYTGKRDRNFEKLLSEKQLLERAEGFILLASRIGLFEEAFAERLGRMPESHLLAVFPHLRAHAEAIRIQATSAIQPEP